MSRACLHPTAPSAAVHPGVMGFMSRELQDTAMATRRFCTESAEAAGLETAPKGTSKAAPQKWALFML